MKCIIVIDQKLPKGLAANTAAVLSISLGAKLPDIVGSDVTDSSGDKHPGLMHIPIPILCSDENEIKRIRNVAIKKDATELFHTAITDVAQRSKNYEEYINYMSKTDPRDLKYLGIALYGDKKIITSITGDLPLYK
jgi:hypothetical protein